MSTFARINNGIAVEIHVVSDDESDPTTFLAGLWGGRPADYVATPDPSDAGYPGAGWGWDGTTFAPPPDTKAV